MLEIKRSSIALAELAHADEYLPFIRPSILPFLHSHSPVGKWISIEARLEGELAGLLLAEVYDEGWKHTAQMYSFIVKPSLRQQGIGRRLFAFAQELLVQEEKVAIFEFFYSEGDPFTPAVEKILAVQGWSPARIMLIRSRIDMENFNPPWLYYPYRLPSSMHFFTWNGLLPQDRAYIEYLGQQRRFLPYLNPFEKEGWIDRETSVGLREEERVIGWCITRRSNPSTIDYPMLYIDSAYLHTGYGIQLLAASLRRQKSLHIRYATFELNVKEIDSSWWRFIKKRLLPLAESVDRIKHAVQVFSKIGLD